MELQNQAIEELSKRIEAMTKTQLDALSLLTRAIDELNSRIESLESADRRPV